jgi:hypothetical protein
MATSADTAQTTGKRRMSTSGSGPPVRMLDADHSKPTQEHKIRLYWTLPPGAERRAAIAASAITSNIPKPGR